MRACDVFGISPGVTALIGGGGKTTLLYRLAEELRFAGSVLVCTSTHIRRPKHLPVLSGADRAEVAQALAESGVVCVGTEAENGKLTAPSLPFSVLAALADYVLVEADGSRGLPLKAHLAHEPVIPENAKKVLLVQGADGAFRPIREVCHRPEHFAARAGTTPDQSVTPELLARVLNREGLGDLIYVNKCETPERLAFAEALARSLDRPVVAGSLWREEYRCLS